MGTNIHEHSFSDPKPRLPPFSNSLGNISYSNAHCEDALDSLSVNRLNNLSLLWLAGRPQRDPLKKSTLHMITARGLELVVYERADMHLLWKDKSIYVKPLPSSLLNYEYWVENFSSESGNQDVSGIYEGALGLLYSYTWLIRWESDLRIAHNHGLLSSAIDYDTWMALRSSFLSTFHRSQISRVWLSWRYDFAELRLNRINFIWRLGPHRSEFGLNSLVRGYQYPYRQYKSFFEENFGVLIVMFVYVTVVLTAMQVGLGLDTLKDNTAFLRACDGFSVFCMLLPVILVFIMLIIFIFLVCFNWVMTRKNLHVQAVNLD